MGVDAETLRLLGAPCPLPAWPECMHLKPEPSCRCQWPCADPRAASAHDGRPFLTDCCNFLIDAEHDLNAFDAKSGDGDTGSTLAGASRALIEAMDTCRLPITRSSTAPSDRNSAKPWAARQESFWRSSSPLRATLPRPACRCASPLPGLNGCGKSAAQTSPETAQWSTPFARSDCPCGGPESRGPRSPRRGKPHRDPDNRERRTRDLHQRRPIAGHVDPGAEAVARLFEHLAR